VSTGPVEQPPGEGVPLPEQNPNLTGATSPANQAAVNAGSAQPYVPSPEVEALTPKTPEVMQPSATTTNPSISNTMLVVPPPPGSPEGVGGILLSPDALLNDPRLQGMVNDFTAQPQARPSSRDLFKVDETAPNEALLNKFVTSQRLRDLWNQIDALQEEVIQNVRADRSVTDVYQQDLLYASTLLLQNAANYDEARQIVYRIRGDLMREKKVEVDIRRYRPALILYYSIWLILVLLLARADPQFRDLMPASLPILMLAFPPIIFAILGSLVNGLLALLNHTTVKRDFDPLYVSWYLINPLLAALLGLVIFIFFVVTGTSFTPNLITDKDVATSQAPLAIWIVAFIVGWQQNTAVQLLNGFLKTVSPRTQEASLEGRPMSAQTPSTTKPPDTPQG